MADCCAHKESCAIFPLLEAADVLVYWTQSYCDGDYARCARYHALRDGKLPPPNLLPSGRLLEVVDRPGKA